MLESLDVLAGADAGLADENIHVIGQCIEHRLDMSKVRGHGAEIPVVHPQQSSTVELWFDAMQVVQIMDFDQAGQTEISGQCRHVCDLFHRQQFGDQEDRIRARNAGNLRRLGRR